MLRHRIIVGSVISLLGILLLGSLYARQRQRARIALLANAACEKEREFLELQKETEQRLTRKYIDGLGVNGSVWQLNCMMMYVIICLHLK